MSILTNVPDCANTALTYDLCVLGAGPVGLSLALEARQLGLRVLVVDGGRQNPAESPRDWTGSHLVDPARHVPLTLATHAGLGGTTWLWGGRCVAFEALDFEPRPQVPGTEWPLRWSDIEPWYGRAAARADCGAAEFRRPLPSNAGSLTRLANFEVTQLERWARQPRLIGSLGAQAVAAKGIDLLFDTRIEDLELGGGDDQAVTLSVRALIGHRHGQPVRVQARRFALAGGALGITQLLLKTQQQRPALFGGPDGPLGRYYMGHIFGSIASLVLTKPADVDWLDFSRDADGSYVRRRFTPSAVTQRNHGLLNTSFYVDNPAFCDSRHGNPTLSAVFLGLAIPAVGRLLVAEAMRLKHIGPAPRRWLPHVLNVLRRPWRAGLDVLEILRDRYLSEVRKPGFILRSDKGIYALNYHAEQAPSPDSRVTLKSPQGDLKVDFHYLPQDVDSVLRAHELLDAELRAAGVGYLEYQRPDSERRAHVLEQASDGFHQIGLTRMSTDPVRGVVDADLRVHGLHNLYIASSGVFTTSGEANPTLLAMALGLRLAHHVHDLQSDNDKQPMQGIANSWSSPMRQTCIPQTGLRVSRLAFGTASLHHLARTSDRLALLQTAVESGFTHFDTSPLYGFGLAETSLGQLPTSLSQDLSMATKVGLYGPPGAGHSIVELYSRKLLGKALPTLNRATVDWQLASAQRSFEASLRRLRRDHVELLFLHEPVAALIAGDEWLAWLQRLQQAGRIGNWGVAGEAPAVATMLSQHPALCPVVQVRDSLSQRQADMLSKVGRPLQFTYGYLADPAGNAETVERRLTAALLRNAEGSVLVSTRRIERVAVLARVAS